MVIMNIYKPPSGRVEAIAVVVVVIVVVVVVAVVAVVVNIIHRVQSNDAKHVLRGSVNRLDCGLSHQVVFVIIKKNNNVHN